MFDRRTGEPLIPIEERAVSTDGVADESLSPTQPFSTPPPLASLAGTLMNPGYAGGINWGGVGVDAQSGLAVSFVNELPAIVRLVPRTQFDPDNRNEDFDASRMAGTPYIMERTPFLSSLGLPCTQPPWGKLVAMDLRKREIAWSVPLGTIAGMASPMTYKSKGRQYIVVAAGGHAHVTDQTGDYLVAFALPD